MIICRQKKQTFRIMNARLFVHIEFRRNTCSPLKYERSKYHFIQCKSYISADILRFWTECQCMCSNANAVSFHPDRTLFCFYFLTSSLTLFSFSYSKKILHHDKWLKKDNCKQYSSKFYSPLLQDCFDQRDQR